jgi:hypothetical protein
MLLYYLIILLIIIVIYNRYLNENNNKETYENQPVYRPLIYHHGYSGIDLNKDTTNTLFTAHPNKMVCSSPYDDQVKHIRLNDSGSPIYTSYNEPIEDEECKLVECPPLIKDVSGNSTNFNVDRYYFPETRHKLRCYQCNYN